MNKYEYNFLGFFVSLRFITGLQTIFQNQYTGYYFVCRYLNQVPTLLSKLTVVLAVIQEGVQFIFLPETKKNYII